MDKCLDCKQTIKLDYLMNCQRCGKISCTKCVKKRRINFIDFDYKYYCDRCMTECLICKNFGIWPNNRVVAKCNYCFQKRCRTHLQSNQKLCLSHLKDVLKTQIKKDLICIDCSNLHLNLLGNVQCLKCSITRN